MNLNPRTLPRKVTAILTAFMMLLSMALPAQAAEERRLKFYFTHTKERIDIVYKRNGRYVPSALKKINRFLRDWRQNKSTKMDPRLLDLLWSVYVQMDTREPIHVVSAYRNPKTNTMLRSRSRGVAKNSQHTLGKAMDFFIPGVKLAELRAAGLRMEVGGVGYYPRSGSPFVHMDTGNVRHWPRMTDSQLAKIFPRGDTTQIPSSGKKQKRHSEALARQKRIAAAEISPPNNRRGGIFARVFNRNKEPATIPTTGQSLSSGDSSTTVASAPVLNVVPRVKPGGVPTELLPVADSAIQLALAAAPAPRAMPSELVAQRELAQKQAEFTVAELRNNTSTPAGNQRSVENAWAQVGDSKSTDVSQIVAARTTNEAAQSAGAPEVASAVMAALSTTRRQTGPAPSDTSALDGPEGTSAAASIAAAILAPEGGIPGRNRNDSFNGGVVTAYAPSAPTPNSRPVFNAALGFGNDQINDQIDERVLKRPTVTAAEELPPARALLSPENTQNALSSEQERAQAFLKMTEEEQSSDATPEQAPIEDRIAEALSIPGIPPRIRPENEQLAALTERTTPADTNPARSASTARTTGRASLSGHVPASATQPSNSGLEFHGGEPAVLASMTTPDTTRSETFVRLSMPNPYAMQGVFQMPLSVVDNGFSSSNTSLRTDKFSGRAIVATKVAQLAQR
ncbi:DUF882 domain-containing protein [Pararhizobium sp. IMCC21322]|uniref:DUF882 domain-containing protein n=1 Tax=Pararhizobium sp. IMCC21322 TaxID=3067903 RepID=UPI002741E884|nr:DUF882 domain-containing protein [Pararhizobium sp. IMCC21322]